MSALKPVPQPRTTPLLGNLPDIVAIAAEGVLGLATLTDALGPIVLVELLGQRILLVTSQELVQEPCDETRFEKTLSRPLPELRRFAGNGLFTA